MNLNFVYNVIITILILIVNLITLKDPENVVKNHWKKDIIIDDVQKNR